VRHLVAAQTGCAAPHTIGQAYVGRPQQLAAAAEEVGEPSAVDHIVHHRRLSSA
jgi:hypothetical protein